ncbi:Mce family protein [Gordonia effusa NBRC 100432]|uniref:Mce family protein n=1 Tax=Gordonia effusa NBRC 100432 TaxID=1077974 RepID=H0R404_9ACTN|nr:MlaD family protein [Gordonia effusa]GAB19805.1 Mce family protein [Gordonia effusa NBRC 100432]
MPKTHNRSAARRAVLTVLAVALATAVTAGIIWYYSPPLRERLSAFADRPTEYCALMPDVVGMYKGNQVTRMGVPVGKVTDIEQSPGGVTVHFTVRGSVRVPADIGATTIATDLSAKRQLALVGADRGGATRPPSRCIEKTLTPRSISESISAVAKIAKDLQSRGTVPSDIVSTASAALAGTADDANALLSDLARAFDQPNADISRFTRIYDALASMTRSVRAGWTEIDGPVRELYQMLDLVNGTLFPSATRIIDNLVDVLGMFNNLSMKFGRTAIDGLGVLIPATEILRTGTDTFAGLLNIVPAFTDVFDKSIDDKTGYLRLEYKYPVLPIPPGAAQKLCPLLKQNIANGCSPTAPMPANLITLLLAAVAK